jgi:hypothetical protein
MRFRLLELPWRARFAAFFLPRVRRIEATLLRLLLEELLLRVVLGQEPRLSSLHHSLWLPQPQRDVLRLHGIPHHPYEVAVQRVEVRLVA